MAGYPRIKICGIRSGRDAQVAVNAGAHAIAFNFVPGAKRYIEPAKARAIIQALGPLVTIAGVFADAPRAEVVRIAGECGLQVLQFHGNESPAYCQGWPYPVIKAFRFGCGAPAQAGTAVFNTWDQLVCRAGEYLVAAFLIDAFHPAVVGGAGRTFDWTQIRTPLPRPLILAGGLHPGNVREAITQVHPYGLDVATGVETGGQKDWEKVRAFIEQARFSGLS
ncbi:MAG: phosphoribosylanthranilate isomerase [Heliobacteriaceae bacterium]|nr:phosphoribosylanthranilate isomerase [Heliobacteriaceae bacterium]MDD4587372.1 phosphoribosylanthranilate isomerase [Heliobacteriaceae bacterium]